VSAKNRSIVRRDFDSCSSILEFRGFDLANGCPTFPIVKARFVVHLKSYNSYNERNVFFAEATQPGVSGNSKTIQTCRGEDFRATLRPKLSGGRMLFQWREAPFSGGVCHAGENPCQVTQQFPEQVAYGLSILRRPRSGRRWKKRTRSISERSPGIGNLEYLVLRLISEDPKFPLIR
jgi:hypothetical protein